MAVNLPGPYEVEYEYTVNLSSVNLTHKLALSCVVIGTPTPGTDPEDIDVATLAAGAIPLQDAVDGLWDRLRLQAGAGTTICIGWTLWRYTPGTLIRTFITAGTVANPAGAAVTSTIDSAQLTMTFRTGNGGILKVVQLEHVFTNQDSAALIPNGAGLPYQIVAEYLLSNQGWVIARDDSYPVAALRRTFGQNEAVFRKRHRQS